MTRRSAEWKVRAGAIGAGAYCAVDPAAPAERGVRSGVDGPSHRSARRGRRRSRLRPSEPRAANILSCALRRVLQPPGACRRCEAPSSRAADVRAHAIRPPPPAALAHAGDRLRALLQAGGRAPPGCRAGADSSSRPLRAAVPPALDLMADLVTRSATPSAAWCSRITRRPPVASGADFIANASHELRTPVTAFAGAAEDPCSTAPRPARAGARVRQDDLPARRAADEADGRSARPLAAGDRRVEAAGRGGVCSSLHSPDSVLDLFPQERRREGHRARCGRPGTAARDGRSARARADPRQPAGQRG